jgi:hypothetical protein
VADITLVLDVATGTTLGATDQVYIIPQNARYLLIQNVSTNPIRWAYGAATGSAYSTLTPAGQKWVCVPVPGTNGRARNLNAETRKITLYCAAGGDVAITALRSPVT